MTDKVIPQLTRDMPAYEASKFLVDTADRVLQIFDLLQKRIAEHGDESRISFEKAELEIIVTDLDEALSDMYSVAGDLGPLVVATYKSEVLFYDRFENKLLAAYRRHEVQ